MYMLFRQIFSTCCRLATCLELGTYGPCCGIFWLFVLECRVCIEIFEQKVLNKKFAKDTCDTYAHYAGHAVNVVSVENFDHFLNSLSEPSQKVSQLLEVLFFIVPYFWYLLVCDLLCCFLACAGKTTT